jgi:beta-glucosidase
MRWSAVFAIAAALAAPSVVLSPVAAQDTARPWMDTTLSPDKRADLVVAAMTADEKFSLVNGWLGIAIPFGVQPPDSIKKLLPGVSGYIPGIPRLGIPAITESDAGLGIANQLHLRKGDQATALPSGLLTAATWNPQSAYAAGTVLGEEARDRGYNTVLGGAMNLAREPRDGRTFEYAGEDPLLDGTIVGEEIRGVQAQGVITTAKHYAFNDQETARTSLSANIDWAAARESDLLAFEIALEHGQPGAIMCAYNKINGVYACENPYLLTKVLKQDWGYPGWVMSDWGATHSTVAAANAGLDQESAFVADAQDYFGRPLQDAVAKGDVSPARLDDMVHRILRSLFAAGLVDHPPAAPHATDLKAHARAVRETAEQGIVLLKNDGVLPLAAAAHRVVVIGGYADLGVMSGGGSSQVVPVGNVPEAEIAMSGAAYPFPGLGLIRMPSIMLSPPSPLSAIKALAPHTRVEFADGGDVAAAVRVAKGADVVIVFAQQWMTEGRDLETLALPGHQDDLIAAVSAANHHVVVVLETGGPVLMPWLSSVSGVMEAWYAGNSGGLAIANVLFGKVDAAGRLPITFPASEQQLPRPDLAGAGLVADPFQPSKQPEGVQVDYREGADVGYRWLARQNATPLFPFGFGLSYAHFALSNLQATGGSSLIAHVTVANTGKRSGWETAQIYVTPPNGVARLVGWSKIMLKPGEKREVVVTADLRTLASFDDAADVWRVLPGGYRVAAGTSSADLPLAVAVNLVGATLKP